MIENKTHHVELTHSQITGKKKLWIDGVRYLALTSKSEFFDTGLFYRHLDPIEGHDLCLRIVDAAAIGHHNPFLWKYYLYVGGENVKALTARRKEGGQVDSTTDPRQQFGGHHSDDWY
jgi:hypothetical protein